MIESIEKFQKIVGSGKGGCVKRIVRAKNMFAQYSKKLIDGKKSVDEQTRIVQSMPLSEFRYCDIKFKYVDFVFFCLQMLYPLIIIVGVVFVCIFYVIRV